MGKSLFPAHEQPGGHQSVVLKSCRKLKTLRVSVIQFPLVGTASGEARPLSSLLFHLGMWTSCYLSPRSYHVQSRPCTGFEHHCSSTELTVLATNWKSNKILIIACQLFSVSFHSKMSSGWQHTECNRACAAAWRGSSPKGFPNRHIFTYLSLPNSLELLYVYQYYYYHYYHQSRHFGTLDSFTRAMWCICQCGFSWLFSSSLALKMPKTYCDNCNRYLMC